MALNFTYKKYKDVYTIQNNGIVVLTYTVTRKECDSSTLVQTATIQVDETITLPLSFIDGVYEVSITDGVETEILDDILFYNNLLLTIISNVEVSLCGCKPCNDCEDCTNCETYLNTLSQVLAFTFVNHPKYNAYISTITETIQCDFTQNVLCMLTNNMINGTTDTKNIYLKIIGLHYLSFYLVDLIQATDEEEANYIKTKYNSAKILKCLRKIGIDVDVVLEEFVEGMNVYYWQLPNLLDDINDVIPIFNDLYLADKNVVPFEEFEQGKTVTYTSIAPIAFAVKETDILNFSLIDSLGNDITDEFDIHYFAGMRTVLYVSKEHASHSSVYFKFKKITFLP